MVLHPRIQFTVPFENGHAFDGTFSVHSQAPALNPIHCHLPMRMLELSNSVLHGRMPPSPLWTTKNQVRFQLFGILSVKQQLLTFYVTYS
jgi:hypothetical protein